MKQDNGIITAAAALSNAEGTCSNCWCREECDGCHGETMCGLLRLYYIDKIIKKV